MNEKTDKLIDELVKKAMKKTAIESPSLDFTNTVMTQVNTIHQCTVTTYKPLISKPMWLVIFAVGFIIVLYIIFGGSTNQTNWLSFIDMSILTENKLSITFLTLKISKTVMYSVVLFGVMLIIQIPILKHYFDKRIAV